MPMIVSGAAAGRYEPAAFLEVEDSEPEATAVPSAPGWRRLAGGTGLLALGALSAVALQRRGAATALRAPAAAGGFLQLAASEGPVCEYARLLMTMDLTIYDPPLWKFDEDSDSCVEIKEGSRSWKRYAFATEDACRKTCARRARSGAADPLPPGAALVEKGPVLGRRGGGLPPWWVVHHVTPAGEGKTVGAYSVVTFSKEQQARYGVDEDGKVVDEKKFMLATLSLAERAGKSGHDGSAVSGATASGGGHGTVVGVPSAVNKVPGLPPWWILHHVEPKGKKIDMGTWKAISFSKEQQERFGIDATGEVKDQQVFKAALAALDCKKRKTAIPERRTY